MRAVVTTTPLLQKVQSALDLVPGGGGPAVVCEGSYLQPGVYTPPQRLTEKELSYVIKNVTRKGYAPDISRPDPDSIALLPFSRCPPSGVAKGVMLTHRNLVANLCQMMQVNPPVPLGKIIDFYFHRYLIICGVKICDIKII